MTSLLQRTTLENPFVGPRSIRYGEQLLGRDRERSELLDLLMAQRILLLYSPSGAGKTSLLQAGLVPGLEAEDMAVPRQYNAARPGHPILVRVGQMPPDWSGVNRYVRSTILGLDECLPLELRTPESAIAGTDLSDYLDRWQQLFAGHRDICLIFDQFEELFTADVTDVAAKRAFLSQIGAFLSDTRLTPETADGDDTRVPRSSTRFAVFALREDFLAQLDPYLDLIPSSLSTRYRLTMLTKKSARAAVLRSKTGRTEFDEDAATKVVDDLSLVAVKRNGQTIAESGPSVEPVQLQVVCRRLWQLHAEAVRLGAIDRPIAMPEVSAVGSVDAALGEFYDEQVADAAVSAGIGERVVREWCGGLISDTGFRTQTGDGPVGDRGRALDALVAGHVIRREDIRGNAWYELSHDRLVAPIQASNANWFASNLSPLERSAKLWDSTSRPNGLLMTGPLLEQGAAWAAANPGRVDRTERDFLQRSGELEMTILREKRAAKRQRRISAVAITVGALAVLCLIFAGVQWKRAISATSDANAQAAEAIRQQTDAFKQKFTAQNQRADALNKSNALEWIGGSYASQDARVSLLAALSAAKSSLPSEPPQIIANQLPSALRLARYDRDYVTPASLSPDGRNIAEASRTDGISIFNVDSGLLVHPIRRSGLPDDIMYNPAGGSLAVAERVGTMVHVDIIDPANGAQIKALNAPMARTTHLQLTWSPSGKTIGVTDSDAGYVLWNVSTGIELRQDRRGQDVAVSKNDNFIAVIDEGKLTIYNSDGTTRWLGIASWGPFSAVMPTFSPDSARLFATMADGTTGVLDLETGVWSTTQRSPLSTDRVMGFGMVSNGTVLWSDSACYVESAKPQDYQITSKRLSPCSAQDASGSMFSADGKRVAVFDGNVLKVFTVNTGAEIFAIGQTADVGAVNASIVVTATDTSIANDGILHYLVARAIGTDVLRWRIKLAEAVTHLSIATGGETLAVTTPSEILAIDTRTGRLIGRAPLEETGNYDYGTYLSLMAISADGSTLVITNDNGLEVRNLRSSRLDVYRSATYADLRDKHNGILPSALALTSDGRTLIFGGVDGTVSTLDLIRNAKGEEVAATPFQSASPAGQAITSVAVSDDQRTIVFGNSSGSVYRWESWRTQNKPYLLGPIGSQSASTMTTMRHGMIAAASDTAVKVWDSTGMVRDYDPRQGVSYEALALTDDGQLAAVTTVSDRTFTTVQPLRWLDLWRAATEFASDQGWAPLNSPTCQSLLGKACPPGAWNPVTGK